MRAEIGMQGAVTSMRGFPLMAAAWRRPTMNSDDGRGTTKSADPSPDTKESS